MCTVSWTHTARGYELLSNRDEKRSRLAASAPSVHTAKGVRYVAPIDRDHGGTWIAVNEYGVGLCILNFYPAARWGIKSRGLIIPSCVHSRTAAHARALVAAQDLELYSPFTLLSLDLDGEAFLLQWDGANLCIRPATAPLISSSVNQASEERRRRALFARCSDLRAFHQSTHIDRPDATTVSLSHVVVSRGDIRFEYHEPCSRHFSVSLCSP